MEDLTQTIEIPTRETVVAMLIAHSGLFASDPRILMIGHGYPDNNVGVLRPVQGGIEHGERPEDSETPEETAIREIREEADVHLDNLPIDRLPGSYTGRPRYHIDRGLYAPVYRGVVVHFEGDELPAAKPLTEERIVTAGFFSRAEAYQGMELIEHPLTRSIIKGLVGHAFEFAESRQLATV